MKYFAVITTMLSLELNKQYREEHLDYLKGLSKEGKVFAKGRFSDGTGGLVIYKADAIEDVRSMVENDPFIFQGARSYEIHEWEMTLIQQ
ncbi:hypothetical protein SD71_10430 [Cohnella kolymensis]|uniref:YCII-related domain-containing protein n=1 Tax=Cohnella kolymensis TaxID=1590652 RepID=A0ABR5A447_9BACL|nr:YciI family protein [Cohnella kolymensis]KIL35814.1 hypothetical protein SD71_10430 [Cohnella kolymensis]